MCSFLRAAVRSRITRKRHNLFLFPALAGAIYGNSCKAENVISNVVNDNRMNEDRGDFK